MIKKEFYIRILYQEVIFPKGGVKLEDTILFGKYQICRIIGCGRSGTVFLARHLALNEYRAIKRVPKEGRTGTDFLKEAMILKSLKHPGIPVIYDYEQDQYYHYLIEEYLEGESLFTLVSKRGNLTRAKTVTYGIELCRIMNYLHSLKPTPILYLDLQPKNLLICSGALKLIDFDQAISAAFSGNLRERYGTVGCAAPEQFTSEPLDVRTDIYAIGALLHYMGTGTFPDGNSAGFKNKPEDGLSAIIWQCIRPQRKERYANVAGVLLELQKLKAGVFAENKISLLKIAVVSSNHGMGATHASLGLSSYLSKKGINNLYVERNESGAAMKYASYSGIRPDRYGICRIGNYDLKPSFGPGVKPEQPEYDVCIEDFGTDGNRLCLEDGHKLILLLCGGKRWEIQDSVKAVRLLSQKEDLRIIFNHISPSATIALPEDAASLSCHRMPYFPDPEKISGETAEFFEEIFSGTGAERELFNKAKCSAEEKYCRAVRKKWEYILRKIRKK